MRGEDFRRQHYRLRASIGAAFYGGGAAIVGLVVQALGPGDSARAPPGRFPWASGGFFGVEKRVWELAACKTLGSRWLWTDFGPAVRDKHGPAPLVIFTEALALQLPRCWRVGATARTLYEENAASAVERCCSAARRAGGPNGRSG